MKPLTLGLLAWLTVGDGALAQNPATASTRSLRGQVVDSRDGVPLRRARVVVATGNRVESIFSDDEGRFTVAIPDPPATPLTVRASKAGYVAAVAAVSPERADRELRFALARGAAVTGRVLDSYRQPVSSAHVTARLVPEATGTATPTRFFAAIDRLGEYRLGGLPAGRYEITAVRVPPELQTPGRRLEDQLFGPREPLELATAVSTVTLAPGAEAQNTDFTIPGSSEACPTGSSRRPAEGTVTATIRGRVTGPSGEPVPCAVVRFVTADTSLPNSYTDQQGRYSIESLPAGTFVLEARKSGYVTLQHGQRRPSDTPAPITLRDGEQRPRIDFVLPRLGTISGTVVDEHGEPLERVMVWAFQRRPIEGLTIWSSGVSPAGTDDRGRYRLLAVEPGTYLIAAMASDTVSTEPGRTLRGYTPVYYPSTLDAATAQRLTIEAGRDTVDVNVGLTPIFMATVTGSALDAAGRPFIGDVTLSVSARSGAPTLTSRTVSTDANGAFVVSHVPPGDYVVKAPGRPAGTLPQFGMQYVTVADSDPPPVTIVTSEGAIVEGRMIVDGAPDTDPSGIGVSALTVDPDYSPGIGSLNAPASGSRDDGSFRLVGVRGPTRLLVAPTPRCESCYVKSVHVNGVDAADSPFDFGLKGGQYRDVEIVLSEGAAIEGRVTAERDAAVGSFSVVVFSTSRDLWSGRSRHVKVQRSVNGAFRVDGLPPGDYFVAAVTRLDTFPGGDQADPDVLEQLSSVAQRVTLAERDHRTLNLRLVRR